MGGVDERQADAGFDRSEIQNSNAKIGMIMFRKRIILMVAVVSASLALTACGSSQSGADTDAKSLTTLTLASPTGAPNSTLAFLPAGVSQGFFEDEGIDLQVKYLKGGTAVMSAVQAGQADVAVTSPEPLLLANAKGGDMQSIYQFMEEPFYRYAFVPGSDVSSPKDLHDARIGTISAGNLPTYLAFINADLAGQGLPPVKADQLLAVGLGAPAAAALQAGQVDLLFLDDASLAGIQAAGMKLDVQRQSAFKSNFPGLALMAKSSTIDDKQEAMQGLLRGLKKSIEWCTTEQEACLKAFASASPGSAPDPAVLAAEWAVRAKLYASHLSGENTEDAWQAVIDMQRDTGALTEDLSSKSLYTNELLPN